ncbi:MAG: hypothetical protein LBT40_05820 [Deltaproteobacteria bacterium]|nr:hypothetical protein [Deltaproteobacteria bacterium]
MIDGGFCFHVMWDNIPEMIDKLDGEAIRKHFPNVHEETVSRTGGSGPRGGDSGAIAGESVASAGE